jgi:hypothetical protein
MATRRRVLQAAGVGAVALPILGQQHTHGAAGTAAGGAYKAKWATAAEMRLLSEAADLIIPRTDTPGASDAKVQEFIDYSLAASTDEARKKVMRDGLRWFGGVKGDRVAALQAASERPASVEGRFFKLLKDLTIDGYYQSKEGLVQELGWHGNTYLPEFKGCTHPEHKG